MANQIVCAHVRRLRIYVIVLPPSGFSVANCMPPMIYDHL